MKKVHCTFSKYHKIIDVLHIISSEFTPGYFKTSGGISVDAFPFFKDIRVFFNYSVVGGA